MQVPVTTRRGSDRKTQPREAVAIAGDAFPRGLKARRPSNIADAAMPEAQNIIDQFRHGLAVVDADLIEARIEHAVDEHARDAGLTEKVQARPGGLAARGEDHAVHTALMKGRQHRKFAVRVVLSVGEENHHAELGAFGLDRADDVAEIGIGDGRDRNADRPARGGLQGARENIGAVSERVDDRLHGERRLRRDPARPVHDVGYGRNRHARCTRHIRDRGQVSSPESVDDKVPPCSRR